MWLAGLCGMAIAAESPKFDSIDSKDESERSLGVEVMSKL